MKNIKKEGITSLANKSCATLAIYCLADAGITDWKGAFDQLITNAKS